MAIDFFNNDVIRGDNFSGREKAEVLSSIAEDQVPDLFKDDEPVTVEIEAKTEETDVPEKEVIRPIKEVVEPITAKELVAQYGGKEYKLPADSKFTHKADGKDVEISLQELLNDHSGKTSWDKKYSELDKERQSYKKELDQVNKYLNEFASKAKTDRIGAFEYLAEAAGMDPLEFRRAIRKDLLSANKNYLEMDDNTRNAFELKEENDYFRSRRELETKKRTDEQAHKEFDARIQSTKQSHGISDDRLQELVTDLKQYGGLDNPSLDDVVNLHVAYNRQDRAIDILRRTDPELLKDDNKISTLESLISGNSKLSDEDLLNYSSKLWGKSTKPAAPKKSIQKPSVKQPEISQKRVIGGGNFDFFK